MSISDKFQIFCTNLKISQTLVNNVSSKYKQITKCLNLEYYESDSETLHSLYVGSYGRGTASNVSDVEMLFILPVIFYNQYFSYSGNGQLALLQAVKYSIYKTFSTCYFGADGKVIKLYFSDGICFKITPCFKNTDGSFTFPDSNSGGIWKTTNPKAEIAELTTVNNNYNKNLTRVCRMVRSWKDQWNVPIDGLLIDTLAYSFLKTWEHKDKSFSYYDWMTRDFFEFLKNQDETHQYWLSLGANHNISRKGRFEHMAGQCYNLSLEALEHESKNQEWSANQKWRQIYGDKFPI
ncbi:MAG: SMODS domain-containing nucleotidyltransferase [Flavobacterium sp.]